MNTDTGRIYELSEEIASGMFEAFQMEAAVASAEHAANFTEDDLAALADRARGQTIVPVSATVAQTMRVGQRELERRKARRRSARRARRRNR